MTLSRQYAAMLGLLAALMCAWPPHDAHAWGQDGHSVIAEIAQRRLTPAAATAVERLLGRGHSLASVASWADDVREARPETYNWHFVNIPLAAPGYDAARDCPAKSGGDCVVAEIERLRNELRCATTDEAKRDALRYAAHFIGDIHQPLHAVGDERGGNGVQVQVEWRGLTCTGRCVPKRTESNLHAVWDTAILAAAARNWGAHAARLEDGWLRSADAQGVDGGSAADWAGASHALGQAMWNAVPANRVLDDAYFRQALPVADRQLALGGLRLARFLNEAYAADACPVRRD